MKVTIVECVMGILAFDRENNVVESVLFPKRAREIVGILQKLQKGVAPEELAELVRRLGKKGYRNMVFEGEGLAWEVREKFGVKASVEKPSAAGEFLRSNLAGIAVETGYVESSEEFYELVHDVSNAMARIGVRRESERRDLLLSQAILALDDLDKSFNLFSNRVKEWYGFYFPELGGLVERNETYLKLVASLTERKCFNEKQLVEEGIALERAEAIAKTAQTSMGGEIGERDLTEIQHLAENLLQLYKSRNDLEDYVDEVMTEVAPNTRSLAGSTLGARLIAAVGGLEDLAKKSASKIQVLGAEKALYRSFRTGTKPPKHGLIFQHKAVHQAPRWQRGKIARALAGKLAIAARLDVYGGEYRGDELRKDFEKRVEEIRERYAEPPKKRKRRPKGRGK